MWLISWVGCGKGGAEFLNAAIRSPIDPLISTCLFTSTCFYVFSRASQISTWFSASALENTMFHIFFGPGTRFHVCSYVFVWFYVFLHRFTWFCMFSRGFPLGQVLLLHWNRGFQGTACPRKQKHVKTRKTTLKQVLTLTCILLEHFKFGLWGKGQT